MQQHAEGLPGHVLHNAYKKQVESFMKQVRLVPVHQIPKNANIISSHVLYKVKILDDGSKSIKARIAPHGNKDKERFNLETDPATCPPTGLRLILSVASLFKWPLVKIDFDSAFLQSGDEKRDVYVKPPLKCGQRSKFYWLLLTAAYGLGNASAKWLEQLDNFFSSLGFIQLIHIPQLFFSSRFERWINNTGGENCR